MTNFNEKHVSARGCKHCLTFQPGVAYAEKQSKAKDLDFDLRIELMNQDNE
jgi:hypothetical protein